MVFRFEHLVNSWTDQPNYKSMSTAGALGAFIDAANSTRPARRVDAGAAKGQRRSSGLKESKHEAN